MSVILPTYYRYRYLAEALEGLARQDYTPLEIIVADQTPASDRPDGFYDRFSDRLPLKCLFFKTPSLTAPRNAAAREARGEILLFLDDDVVVGDSLISAHVRVMFSENVDAVCGAVASGNELPNEYPWDVAKLDPVRLFLAVPNYHWSGMMIGVTSGNLSIRREVFLSVGGFDENLPRMVDFELGYRLFRSGAKIYFSDAPFARHVRAPDGGTRHDPQNYDRLVSALYIHKKHFPGWTTKQFVLKQLYDSYWRRRNVIQPWNPLVQTYKLIRANRIVNKKLSATPK